ncbi:MAG: endonuclease/exonuclease/phosphatase family protein [Candidatus Nealsonbacteria bacterium]
MKNISLFCWNIANPSSNRAAKQAGWLRKRPEDFLVLTEAKRSEGCFFLKRYFETCGYYVIFPKIEGREYGTMIVSKHPLAESLFSNFIDFLPSRVVAVTIALPGGILEIIGLYVPSRDANAEKIKRKKRFLENVVQALRNAPLPNFRIVCGDFNILEPDHVPHYPFFEKWEYAFYRNLMSYRMRDVFRHVNPSLQEYSWIGRTGDGYRYDHCFVSENILHGVKKCFYFHEPREKRLSDHSAIIVELSFTEKASKSL